MRWRFLFVLAVCSFAARTSSGAIIDHSSIAGVLSASQGMMDYVGEEKWLFTHASVGGNMVDGMNALNASDPSRYRLTTASVSKTGSGSLLRASNPPASTTPGTIYECNRDNPGWQAKIQCFQNSVAAGWTSPKVQFDMDKFCYIDQTANATTYLNAMTTLETANPATKFVYTTMPLQTYEDSDNILRNQFNQAVRTYCLANNKLLFDIADIQAYDPTGNQSTFTYGGQTYQKLYSNYSSDGGHLNSTGAERVATGWYAVAIYGTRYLNFNESWTGGSSSVWGAAGNWTTADGSVIVPDAPGIKVTLGNAGARATVDLASTGRTVGGITFQANVPTNLIAAGTTALTLDNNGNGATLTIAGTHGISAGVYFKDDLEIGGGGTLDLSGSLGGDAGKTLTVLSGTTVNLIDAANNIQNSILVYGQLNATSLEVPSLTIGGVSTLAVPEPSGLVLALMSIAGMAIFLGRWKFSA